jgi:hypothetical protein
MMGQMKDLNNADWWTIKNVIGLEKIIQLYHNCDLISLVNWSELDNSNNIWQGLLTEVFPFINFTNEKAFFDLSDCSKRTNESILQALKLIEEIAKFCKVTLSLNKNEAKLVYKAIYLAEAKDDIDFLGRCIFDSLRPEMLLIHTSRKSQVWDGFSSYRAETFFIENPKISTGAGDNFNAGFVQPSY